MSVSLPGAGQNQKLLIDGPVGQIEALLAAPREALSGISVICHPHPLYGGAMSNKVTYMLAATALEHGMAALRFNFRGVGQSEGAHDQGQGEVEDTVFLCQWLRQQYPGLPLMLAGFSFGGFVSLQAAATVQPVLQVSVAPPFRYFDGRERPAHPGCPWLILHGRDDDVVAYQETVDAVADYDPPPQLDSFDEVGHFFHGRLQDLRASVSAFVVAHADRLNG